jgi:hypothetical protein
MIRLLLPAQLQVLAGTGREVQVSVEEPITLEAALDALEARYPSLRGTLRNQVTRERRPFIRFFACGEDLSLEPAHLRLPDEVVAGKEPLRVVGSMAGG